MGLTMSVKFAKSKSVHTKLSESVLAKSSYVSKSFKLSEPVLLYTDHRIINDRMEKHGSFFVFISK